MQRGAFTDRGKAHHAENAGRSTQAHSPHMVVPGGTIATETKASWLVFVVCPFSVETRTTTTL
jgi:hypothetical protein